MFKKKMAITMLCLCVSLAAHSVSRANARGPAQPVLEDVNPDPSIVEVNLTAQVATKEYDDSVETTVWSYNGIVPGPIIEGRIGQTLVVNFRNELPDPTTVHWHGLEVPANMDGSNAPLTI